MLLFIVSTKLWFLVLLVLCSAVGGVCFVLVVQGDEMESTLGRASRWTMSQLHSHSVRVQLIRQILLCVWPLWPQPLPVRFGCCGLK